MRSPKTRVALVGRGQRVSLRGLWESRVFVLVNGIPYTECYTSQVTAGQIRHYDASVSNDVAGETPSVSDGAPSIVFAKGLAAIYN